VQWLRCPQALWRMDLIHNSKKNIKPCCQEFRCVVDDPSCHFVYNSPQRNRFSRYNMTLQQRGRMLNTETRQWRHRPMLVPDALYLNCHMALQSGSAISASTLPGTEHNSIVILVGLHHRLMMSIKHEHTVITNLYGDITQVSGFRRSQIKIFYHHFYQTQKAAISVLPPLSLYPTLMILFVPPAYLRSSGRP
jgi:hypothetical protein